VTHELDPRAFAPAGSARFCGISDWRPLDAGIVKMCDFCSDPRRNSGAWRAALARANFVAATPRLEYACAIHAFEIQWAPPEHQCHNSPEVKSQSPLESNRGKLAYATDWLLIPSLAGPRPRAMCQACNTNPAAAAPREEPTYLRMLVYENGDRVPQYSCIRHQELKPNA
jgi:hypothetical protein